MLRQSPTGAWVSICRKHKIKKMIKELKNKHRKVWLVAALASCVIAVGVLILVFGNVFLYLTPAKNINEVDPTTIKPGMHLEGNLRYVRDCYAVRGEEDDPEEAAFLVPIGDDDSMYYIGMLCSGKKAKEAMNSYNALWEGYEEYGYVDFESIPVVHINGIVKELGRETQDYFREYVDKFYPGEQEYNLAYEINVGIFVGHEDDNYIYCFILVVAAFAFGVFSLFYAFLGSNVKAVEKYLRTQPDREYALGRIEKLYHTAGVEGVRVDTNFVLGVQKSSVYFGESNNVLWAYQSTTQHRTNGIPTGKTYAVMVRTKDGKKELTIPMRNEAACQAVLKYMGTQLPWIIIGYDDNIMRMYRKERETLVREVEERKSQMDVSEF